MTEVSLPFVSLDTLCLAMPAEHNLPCLLPVSRTAKFCARLGMCDLTIAVQVALKVGMTCQGCVGAVDRVLKKMPGTERVNAQKVPAF